MACTFPIERETAVWPPPASFRELLLDADPDERRIADHLAHGELYVAKTAGLPPESLLSVRRGNIHGKS